MQLDQTAYGNHYPLLNPILYPWEKVVPRKKNQKRILIVDDDEELLDLLKTVFKNDQYVKLFTAQDPFEVMEMMSVQVFDLVILDWNLPKLNGFETLLEVENGFKYDPNLPLEWEGKRVKVVVFTGNEKKDCKVCNSKHFRYSGYVPKTQNFASVVRDLRTYINKLT